MITIYPFDRLGRGKYDWLDTRYHFSFAQYYNSDRMGFGPLRVINDDIIAAQNGFPMHPHRDMEIITYVRKGAISHQDNMGNAGRTQAGDVQVMSAGSGIFHAEYNLEDTDTQLYQIWITPNKMRVQPRWDQRQFPKKLVDHDLPLLVSGDERDDALFIHQDARIYAGRLAAGKAITHHVPHGAYMLVSDGAVRVNDHDLSSGDGAEITAQSRDGLALNITADADDGAEIIVIHVNDLNDLS